nr:hypothetical protein CFP56_58271 [Quercus suber]
MTSFHVPLQTGHTFIQWEFPSKAGKSILPINEKILAPVFVASQPAASLFDFPASGTPTSVPQVSIPDHLPTHDIPSNLIPPLGTIPPETSVSVSADLKVDNSADSSNPSPSIQPIVPSTIPSSIPLRKSSRITKPPAYLTDFKCSTVVHDNHPSPSANKSVETIDPITSAYFFFFNAVVHVTRGDQSRVSGYALDWAFAGARTFIGGGGFGSVRIRSNRRLGFRAHRCDL